MDAWLSGIVTGLAIYGLFVLATAFRRKNESREAAAPKASGISLLLLVKNKERNIEGIIRYLLCTCFGLDPEWPGSEIVVVDDCSTDATPEILERLVRQFGYIKLVRMEHVSGSGKSAAEVGLFLCRSKYTLVCDLLGPMDLAEFRETIACLFSEKLNGENPETAAG